MNFEPIYAALYAKLAALPGLKTASRRLAHWSDVPAKDQPALFLTQTGEAPEQVRGAPPKWRLTCEATIYVTSTDRSTPPSVIMNPIIASIRSAIAAPPGQPAQTLNNLCAHCWIAGQIEFYDGVLGDQIVAIVPLEILTA